MKNTFLKKLFDRNLDIRERIFRMILFIGSIATVISFIETFIVTGFNYLTIMLVLLLFLIIVANVLTIKYERIELAGMIIGLALSFLIFPLTFFINGGILGGATIWMAINILYAFLIFSGKKLVFLVVVDILTSGATYLLGYFKPDLIKQLNGTTVVYMDSFFSLIIVSLVIGAMIRFQIKAYEEEREVVKEQTQILEENSKSKDGFFANMSHELRTPVNTIIGLNEMILRQDVSEKVASYAMDVENAGKMLLSLVNDVIDLSQMELKKMEIVNNEYDTIGMIIDVIGITNVKAKEKKLHFYLDIDEKIPRVLKGDKKRIEQVLINLMTNAVKYTNEGAVTFTMKADEIIEDTVKLKMSVQDTGIGIRKENIDKLYDSFRRLDSKRNENVQGSGLGLAITKQLVDLMGGEITVDSIYSRGSTFTVEIKQEIVDALPIGKQEVYISGIYERKNHYEQLFEAPGANILVVDDNEMNLRVLKELLHKTEVKIDTAVSGKECLELTRKNFYHVVILDYFMPDINGFDLLHKIKKQPNGLCKNSAFILLTANTGSDISKKCQNEGFDAYLEKPVDGILLEEYLMAYIPEDLIIYSNTKINESNGLLKPKVRKKKKIRITTDSISDFPEELSEKYDIDIIYNYINTPNGRFRDCIEINSDLLEEYIVDGKCVAYPDAASVEEYEDFFANELDRAETVIHISMAEKSGVSYSNAMAASGRFDHVHVVDSSNISGGQTLVVLKVIEMVETGFSAQEIIEVINDEIAHVDSAFITEGIEMFYNAGRIGSFFGKFISVFKFKPVFFIRKSDVKVKRLCIGSVKTSRKRFVTSTLRNRKVAGDVLVINYCGIAEKDIKEIKEYIEKTGKFNNIYVHKFSFAVASIAGRGALGLSFAEKKVKGGH